MARINRIILLTTSTFIFSTTGHASILGFKQLSIDFTNAVEASSKAVWARPELMAVSANGLGWTGEGNASLDAWIQTQPIAIGESWRAPANAMIRVSIRPVPSEITQSSGQKYTPDAGDVFVRYSPDLTHWSFWQALQRAQPESIEDKASPGRFYSGTVRVPNRDQGRYHDLLKDYSRRDVPWSSDEEAAVKWILNHEPDFFSKQIPFIGYVQFLYEGQVYSGQPIRSFKADISFGMSGMHLPPKDQKAYEGRNVPWRFTSK